VFATGETGFAIGGEEYATCRIGEDIGAQERLTRGSHHLKYCWKRSTIDPRT